MPTIEDMFQKYVDHKLQLARRLGNGDCGGTYSDACILTAALLSGISADLWPGTGRDRRRFVELWVQYAPAALAPSNVSVPLLVRRLRDSGRHNEADQVSRVRPRAFGPGRDAKVLVSDDVDVAEGDIIAACSTLSLKDVRARSYPVVFYEHIRSTLIHEYHLDNVAVGVPMTERHAAAISYSNISAGHGIERRIHFHLDWLLELAAGIADSAKLDITKRPLEAPGRWWIQG